MVNSCCFGHFTFAYFRINKVADPVYQQVLLKGGKVMRNGKVVEHDHCFGSCSACADSTISVEQSQVSDQFELFSLACVVSAQRDISKVRLFIVDGVSHSMFLHVCF